MIIIQFNWKNLYPSYWNANAYYFYWNFVSKISCLNLLVDTSPHKANKPSSILNYTDKILSSDTDNIDFFMPIIEFIFKD